MLQHCPALPTIEQWQKDGKIREDGAIVLGDFLFIYGELQGQYIECAIRLDCLIEATKGKLSDKKTEKCLATPAKEGQ